MSLSSTPLDEFLEELSSGEPVPGGGSVAALSGALATSLLEMVCRLTIGKKGYEPVGAEMQESISRLEPIKQQFQELMQADIDAYAQVINAYRLPKSTDSESKMRSGAIQAALKHASDVPLRTAEMCAEVMRLARPIAERGNKNASSDAAVGTLMAEAGLRAAALNVLINLGSIKDPDYVSRYKSRVTDLVEGAEREKQVILAIVEGRL